MAKRTDTPTDLFASIGADAVAMQAGWDRIFETDLERFGRALRVLRSALGDDASSLAPRRTLLRTHEVDARVRIGRSRRLGGGLALRVMNHVEDLAYARTSETVERDSRMRITIEQVAARTESTEAHDGSPSQLNQEE